MSEILRGLLTAYTVVALEDDGRLPIQTEQHIVIRLIKQTRPVDLRARALLVGADVDRHLTADPVRSPDPAYDQLHAWLADLVHVEQVDPDITAARERADNRAQGPGGPPAPADALARES